jgi:signal peptidase II
VTPEPARLPDVRVGSSAHGFEPVSHAARDTRATASQWIALAAVAIAAFVADQATKHLVASSLELGDSTHVLGPLDIHHVQNTGIAFGLFGGATALVVLFTSAAIGWMLVFFARSGSRHALIPVALGFLIGGSASNLVDRVRLGHVTDFLDLGFWPAFNLADSFICIGVALLVYALFAAERTPPRLSAVGNGS